MVTGSNDHTFTQPYVLKQVSGVTIGILGLACPNTDLTTAEKNVAGMSFQPPLPAVNMWLPEMRQRGAETIVVLSYLGLVGDKRLAASANGIDAVIGGHSHNRMLKAERVGNTLIVQSGAPCSDLGRLDLSIEEKGKVVEFQRTLISLDHANIASDPSAAELLRKLLEPHRDAIDEVIGRAAGWLVRAQTLAGQQARKRDEESPVDSLRPSEMYSRLIPQIKSEA